MPINPERKLTGLLVPVFALRRDSDLGIGDTGAVKEAIDFCAEHMIGVLQVLPINETGGDNSPYNAISSVALDPTYIEVAPHAVPSLSREDFEAIAPGALARSLQDGPVKYPQVKALKEELLRAAFQRFKQEHIATGSALSAELSSFIAEHSAWLPAYTLFRTLVKENNGSACWTEWHAPLRNAISAEQWLETHPEADRLSDYRGFCAFVQWIAFRQWRQVRAYAESLGVELMGDVPFGVSRFSADVWSERELFDLNWYGGAPPEPFFKTDVFVQKWGQNWGIPLFNWTAHVDQDFSWWRQRVQRVGDFFHHFRIDHVLGFFRIYAFPWPPELNDQFVDLSDNEAAARTGGRLPRFLPYGDDRTQYQEMNGSQGAAILKVIIDAAGSTGVVAEDLGVVPPYVRPVLRALSIPGFYIPQFERQIDDLEFKPQTQIPSLAVATYGTHDHQPLEAFYDDLVTRWQGPQGHEAWLELQRLMRFLALDDHNPPESFTADLHKTMLAALLNSNAWLAAFMITDLIGTSQRFNEPGSAADSNWSQRLSQPLSSLASDPGFAPRLNAFKAAVRASGRAPARTSPLAYR